jgi:hypothetical protein
MDMKLLLILLATFIFSQPILAQVFIFEPYYRVSSTKKITPKRSQSTETETISQREEKGLRGGIRAGRFFKLMLSLGQSYHVNTSKTSAIKDEYNQIDLSKELSSDTVGKEQKKKETQNKASLEFGFDPSFWIFILQAKAGVVGTQRILRLYADDVLQKELNPDPTWKPTASLGVGVRLWRGTYFMVEYGGYFYAFPKSSPFERQASISYGINF